MGPPTHLVQPLQLQQGRFGVKPFVRLHPNAHFLYTSQHDVHVMQPLAAAQCDRTGCEPRPDDTPRGRKVTRTDRWGGEQRTHLRGRGLRATMPTTRLCP